MKDRYLPTAVAAAIFSLAATATEPSADVQYCAGVTFNAGSGDFAPNYIMANNHGTVTQPKGGHVSLAARHLMDTDRRFSWGAGAKMITGIASDTDYERYSSSTQTWSANAQGPANIWLQELYAEIKWRSLFLSAGLKETGSPWLDNSLSSGDMIQSPNARPIPQVRAGFIEFQNIPFTNGWLQIQGELSYGKFTDNNWLKHHYNYYNKFITLGTWYTYKQLFFRTKPTQPFSATIGLQLAGQFGGTADYYIDGKNTRTIEQPVKIKDFWNMLVPTGNDEYYEGNHIGSWDWAFRYRLRSGDDLRLYGQWIWEDGSGIGKLNGFDGLWGLEWHRPTPGVVSGIVVEYLDLMNQSGPLHFDPADEPNTTLHHQATGGDNYYNNTYYNGYANYGMSLGSPLLPGPIYNRDGYMAFVDNRVRGFHIGINGSITPAIDYRILGGYRSGYGAGRQPRATSVHATSAMAEAMWRVPLVTGLTVSGRVAFDTGSMVGRNFGVLVGICYTGALNFKTKIAR